MKGSHGIQFCRRRNSTSRSARTFIDCDMYLALWVEKHNLTFQKYEDMDRPPTMGIAASYSNGHPWASKKAKPAPEGRVWEELRREAPGVGEPGSGSYS